MAYRCEVLQALISASFTHTEPGAVFLDWGDFSMALDQVEGAPGTHYAGRWNDGLWTFQTQGRSARFGEPGKQALACRQEIIG